MPEPFTIVSIVGISIAIGKLVKSVGSEIKYQVVDKNKSKGQIKEYYMVDIKNINHEACTICLEEPDECIQLKCGHIFHKECINKWLPKNKTCPNCRKIMISY